MPSPPPLDKPRERAHDALKGMGKAVLRLAQEIQMLVSARQAVRLFAYKAGMKLIAAAGKVHVQAQKDGIEVSALKDIQIVSVNGEVHITGKKKVVFIGGGSFTEWSADGITHGTAGSWQEHAAMHASKGPKSMPVVMPEFPAAQPFDEQFQAMNLTKRTAVAGLPFIVKKSSGEELVGTTNAQGKTPRFHGLSAEPLEVTWGGLQEEGGLVETSLPDQDHMHDEDCYGC